MSTAEVPLALYVHFPWCARKCPYCDFNSHVRDGALPEAAYVDALLRDLDAECATLASPRPLVSLFLGGGTPSLFSPAAIARLLAGIRARLAFAADVEITLEANPGTVDERHFAGYREAGVNRLSIGVQSFDDAMLHALGRIHDGARARLAIGNAQRAGFTRINVDLMHGLPGQDDAAAVADLRHALDTGVEHLSWYQLTIEPNTVFHRRPPALPDDDALGSIEDAGFAALAQAGFARYEVSAWSRPGCASRHNLNYWRFGDYLAIGAGAHGKVSTRDDAGVLHIERYQKSRTPDDYLADQARRQPRSLAAGDRILEFMLNALRLRDGVAEGTFVAHTGLPVAAIAPTLAALRARGLLRDDRIGTTDLGYRHLDSVVAEFLPDEEAGEAG